MSYNRLLALTLKAGKTESYCELLQSVRVHYEGTQYEPRDVSVMDLDLRINCHRLDPNRYPRLCRTIQERGRQI